MSADRVSLVATVLNEAGNLGEWWTSIAGQTLSPDEVVVVDGGSRDGTAELLREMAEKSPFPVRVEVREGVNIARGRNEAIRLATHDIIAVTDAGCVLAPDWLERITAPLRGDEGLDLVAGFYQPLTGNWFEEVSACATLPLPWEAREGRFMPSSRSIAFRRRVWERTGGYPEWLDIGEDMYFNHAWKGLGVAHKLEKEALVYWRMRGDLRSLLRQDPDVIMVGETRDPETAQAAIRAALTGHLVFSTLHTNDAAGAVSRLLDMGIEPFLVASSVEGLIAQRLVRVLCPDCKVPYTPTPEVLARLKVNRLDVTDATLMRPAGCERCRYTGFRGRTAIYEIIKVTEDLKQMIVARRPSNEIKQQAIANGMRTIREDGWLKVRAGLTTIDEVLRVTMEDEFGGVTYDD